MLLVGVLFLHFQRSYKMTITYKLQSKIVTPEGEKDSDYVFKLDDSVTEGTTSVHKELNGEYVQWVADGNTPEEAD